MQLELSIHALEDRACRIGIPLTRLAALAGVAASTLYRIKEDVSPQLRTLDAVNRALQAAELEVLAHLLTLYPHAALPAAAASPVAPSLSAGEAHYSSEVAA